MKRPFTAAILFLLVGVALILFFSSNQKAPPPAPSPTNEAATAPSAKFPPAIAVTNVSTVSPSPVAVANSQPADVASTQPQNLADRAGERVIETNSATDLPPEIVLQNVRRAVHQYGEMFGGNPVGTNPEITAALAGKNPKQINFLNAQPGMKVNDNGELVDPWGTPYFFHQLSGTEMEIHSAGPDKVMWTSDDLVAR